MPLAFHSLDSFHFCRIFFFSCVVVLSGGRLHVAVYSFPLFFFTLLVSDCRRHQRQHNMPSHTLVYYCSSQNHNPRIACRVILQLEMSCGINECADSSRSRNSRKRSNKASSKRFSDEASTGKQALQSAVATMNKNR